MTPYRLRTFNAPMFLGPALRTDKELARFILHQQVNTNRDNIIILIQNCLPQNSSDLTYIGWVSRPQMQLFLAGLLCSMI